MKISTKGRYGLKAVLDIAIGEEAVSVSSIAKKENISENYLEKLIALLKKAGIVNSVRGAKGGYTLTRDLSEISVGEVLRALEGDLKPVDCADLDSEGCESAETCMAKSVWKRIAESINMAVDNLMLSDLIKDFKDKNRPDL